MTATAPLDATDYRLPYDVAPRRYDLLLSPDLSGATFHGELHLELEVLSVVDRVVMNAAELTLEDAALVAGWASAAALEDEPAMSCSLEIDAESERATFLLPVEIEPGRYTLSCRFDGVLNDKLCGFYRSVFVDDDGVEHALATTQFEDTDARRAFPCFDEPDRKAVFSIALDEPPGMLALSNAAELDAQPLPGGGRRVRFADTITMSSYLVACIVGPLEATAPIDVDGVPVRIVHVPGRAHLTQHALDAAAHALGYFSAYFGLPYPGDKLDLVAIPDFASGAMENLGCVTFREAILLAEPDRASRAELERLSEVVEHELAHMWFGDLVTMGWWNGIWLNEAFATFMALKCQDDYHPEWQCFASFARARASAFGVDGLHTTRPIEFAVRHPDDAAAMFDVLTYEKGASVLWMLEQFLGEATFRDGVRRYLAAHAYANAETHDLWDALETTGGDTPVRELMDTWIFQGGFPLVAARTSDGVVTLSQQPFHYLDVADAAPALALSGLGSAIGRDWSVPLLAAPAGAPAATRTRLVLREGPATLEVPVAPLVVNAGGCGFYRVAYDAPLRAALLDSLASLTPLERYGLLADAWATVLSGGTDLADFLDMIPRFASDTDPHVWSVVLGALGTLDLVADESARPALQRYTRDLLAPELDRLGWEKVAGEDPADPLLRSSLVAALGTIGADESVQDRCAAMFATERSDGVDPDLVASVLAVVAEHAGRAEFDELLARFRRPVDPLDERRYLNALGRLGDPDLAAVVHELTRREIRSQDAPYVLGAMLASRQVGPATWHFLGAHFDELERRFPGNSIHRMLAGVAGLAALDPAGEPLLLGDVSTFLDRRVTGARRRLVAQSLERLEINVALGRRLRGRLGALLAR